MDRLTDAELYEIARGLDDTLPDTEFAFLFARAVEERVHHAYAKLVLESVFPNLKIAAPVKQASLGMDERLYK